MFDGQVGRVEREIALAAFGGSLDTFGSWVLDRLTTLVDTQAMEAGDVLWKRGEPLEFLYFMRQGRVQAQRDDAPPWTFEGRGLLGAFEGHRHHANRTATALEGFSFIKIHR